MDRHTSKTSMQEREVQFEIALEAARMGAWDSNFVTGELTWSRAVESLFGLKPGSFAGTREALYELIHKDDRGLVQEALDRAIEEGVDFVVDHRVTWPDGSLHWLANHGRVIKDDEGKPVRLVGVVRDMTRRLKAEAQQDALLQINRTVQEMTRSSHLEDMMRVLYAQLRRLDIDFQGLAVHWIKNEETKTFESYIILPSGEVKRMIRDHPGIYGIWKAGQVRYRRDVAKDPGELSPQKIEELARRYEVPVRCLLDIPRLRSTFALSSDHTNAFSDEDIRFLERVADVLTVGIARMEDLERLEAQNLELQEANLAKSEFLARMSHEIRTPMNGVIGMAELLSHTELTAQQREYLNIVTNSAESLLVLINDILDFSKIEAGKLDLESIAFSLQDTLGDTLQTLGARASEGGLELACHILPDVPDGLIGDPGRFRQIVVNLVGNAIKFTQDGEVTVRVGVESVNAHGVCLRFEVIDTGVGISKDTQTQIFDAFNQADTSTTREFGGTGLGLTIASQLVDMMGGKIGMESEIGVGSTFYFTALFGLHKVARTTIDLSALEGLRVLVVDDNLTNRQILAEMLGNWGMIPRVVSDGFAALAELERAAVFNRAYGLAILDVMMPKMDGFQLAHRIREQDLLEGLQLLILSSAGQTGKQVAEQELGIAKCLIKPVKQSNLLNAISEAMGYREEEVLVETSPADATPAHSQRILIGEDGLVNQLVAQEMLTQCGYTVSVAKNGREVLEAFERDSFDLILMDVQMPEIDGLEATRMIRELEQEKGGHIPIIAMTASAMKGDRERCLEAGMDGYVAKPIKSDTLYAAVDKVWGINLTDNPEAPEAERLIFDWEEALGQVGGNEDILRRAVALFFVECPRLMKAIGEAIAGGHPPELEQSAHALKGTVRIFCAESTIEAAQELELLGSEGDLGQAEGAYRSLEEEVALLLSGLKERLASQDAG